MSSPTASAINIPTFKYILNLYPSVIELFYTTKVQDKKKREQALATEKWRYDELPKLVKTWKKDDGLKKEQLERLVQWKITHGTYRPFLPAQIRKNDPRTVESETSTAYRFLTGNTKGQTVDDKILRTALDGVCKLNGVGPATGTLLLSIFQPENIAFFEDELYYWLLPDGSAKLKYTNKEYLELHKAVENVRYRLGKDDESIQAWEVEKVGFVIGHWNDVRDEDREKITQLLEDETFTIAPGIEKRKASEAIQGDQKRIKETPGLKTSNSHSNDVSDRTQLEEQQTADTKLDKSSGIAIRRSRRIRK